MKPTVGIYRTSFPWLSESFIVEQARSLRRFSPVFFVRDYLTELPGFQVKAGAEGHLNRAAFALTGNPGRFGHSEALAGCSILHAHFGPDGVYALGLGRKYEKPLVVTFHGGDITQKPVARIKSLKPAELRYLFLKSQLQKEAKAAVAISRFIAARLEADGWEKRKIHQIYLGVDTEIYKPGWAATPPYFLSIAKHVPVKGLDLLVRAFGIVAKQHKRVVLKQVGIGPDTSKLKELVASLGIQDRVHFLGSQTRAQVSVLLQGAISLVLSSLPQSSGAEEGLGLVLNEASSCAIPVIGTNTGGIPEAIVHNETGLLVEPFDISSLAEAMDSFLGDEPRRKRMGSAGRELVLERFNIHKQVAKLEQLYESQI